MQFLFESAIFLTSTFLILLILIQRGRGGGLAGALGGMGGQSAFGTKAGDLFTRITVGVAAVWILLSVAAIAVLNRSQRSVFGEGAPITAPSPGTAPSVEGTPSSQPATESPPATEANKAPGQEPALETEATKGGGAAASPAASTPPAAGQEAPSKDSAAPPAPDAGPSGAEKKSDESKP